MQYGVCKNMSRFFGSSPYK